ncbi:hypothetical protein [Haloferula sp. A504]|uniref:hypothetical protein n=1 Tax=Haloferula sp. A504 TaxID=3373601 RepID=UPI0031C5AF4F|nr:hypothetical protein [Verrucomicrobiaceae bacterium E54]
MQRITSPRHEHRPGVMVLRRHTALLLALLLALVACDRSATPAAPSKPASEPQEAPGQPEPPAPTPQATKPAPIPFEIVGEVAGLIDPVRLDGLQGKRAANRSLRRVCFVLESARQGGHPPAAIIDAAQEALEVSGTARAEAVKASLIRNLDILEKLGCLEPAGMAKLETSNAPTITRGPYAGDIASVDHIIPRSVCEELDERLYNLEFMPSRMNSGKGNRVTERKVQIGRRWNRLGLLSDAGLQAVELAADRG